jgi:NACalpha-BTF3-like transcription factor
MNTQTAFTNRAATETYRIARVAKIANVSETVARAALEAEEWDVSDALETIRVDALFAAAYPA